MWRNSIIPFILIITSIGIGFGMIKPKYDEIKVLKQAEERFDEGLTKAKEIETISANLADKLDGVSEEQREKLSVILPAAIDQLRLLNNVYGIGLNHGVVLSSATVADPAMNGNVSPMGGPIFERRGYSELKLSIGLSMDYQKFRAFLKDLERSVQLLDVRSISFASSDTDEQYTYQIEAATFSLNESSI